MKELLVGQRGIRIIVADSEMLIYSDWGEQLLFGRPIYKGEWEQLWAFLAGRGEVEVKE